MALTDDDLQKIKELVKKELESQPRVTIPYPVYHIHPEPTPPPQNYRLPCMCGKSYPHVCVI